MAYSGPATSEAAKQDSELLSNAGVDSVYIFKGRILDNRMAHATFLQDPCDASIVDSPKAEVLGSLHSNIILSNVGDFPNISVGDIVYGDLDTGNNNLYNLQYINMTSVNDIFKVEDVDKKLEECYDLKSKFTENWNGSTNGGFDAGPITDISPFGLRHGKERVGSITDIALHYTVTINTNDAIQVLASRGLSYNYIIDQNGAIITVIDPDYEAYHAGSASRTSIGISFVNLGYDSDSAGKLGINTGNWFESGGKIWEPYTEATINSTINLISGLLQKYPKIINIYGHEDGNAKKADPGPAFDQYWERFYELGLQRAPFPATTKNRSAGSYGETGARGVQPGE